MAKKKKKKKSEGKLPYVHIDVLPEEEQLPDASIAPEMPGQQPQGQPAATRGQQRVNDPRRRGEGFEPYAAEVVSASGKGLSKKKADGKAPVDADEDSDVTPFVIPVFRKSDTPQPGRGMHPMQQRMYGTGQFPPVGGGTPNANPRQNLTQIQQNLLNHHNVARHQAAQNPMRQQPSGQQLGPQAHQQMPQGNPQAGAKQGTGQFAPVSNQMAAQQSPQTHQQPQPHAQAQQVPQGVRPQGGQPMRGQSTQAIPQGAMQAAANAAAARATQSRAAAAQAAIQSTAQAHQASAQTMHPHAAGAAMQQGAAMAQQRQGMPVNGQPGAQVRAAQGAQAQSAAGAMAQFPATQPQGPVGKGAAAAPASDSEPKAAEGASKDKTSEPLLDPKAAEESPMFDKPPVSIEEGMRKSTSGRKTRRRVTLIIVILIVLLGGAAIAYMLLSEQGVVPRISIETATVQVTPQNSSNSNSANGSNGSNGANGNAGSTATDPGTMPETSSGGDLSGTVVYQYTANTASGVEYKVEETVTFQANGDCMSSTMNMTFPDAASAKTFTDNLARDYGTSFKLDSLNGNNAVVTIDNSGLHLTRDEYENALRYSVSDLVVNK